MPTIIISNITAAAAVAAFRFCSAGVVVFCRYCCNLIDSSSCQSNYSNTDKILLLAGLLSQSLLHVRSDHLGTFWDCWC